MNVDVMGNMKHDGNDKIINKADVILLAVLLLAAGPAYLILNWLKIDGYKVEIRVEGELVKELSLSEDTSYVCKTSHGSNTIIIKEGAAYVTDADCPDKICEDYKPISEIGDVIICLPHKLVVEVAE